MNAEIAKLEDKFYKLLAQTLVPDLDKFEQLFQERGSLEAEINLIANNSEADLEPIPVSPTSVLGLSIPGNDMRAPSIGKSLIEAIQLHHQIYLGAIKRGIKPKFKPNRELLAEVGHFTVTDDGEIRRRSPEQLAADHLKHEANRFRPKLKEEVEVN